MIWRALGDSAGCCGGRKGRDGEIHLWWERVYDDWLKTQKASSDTLKVMGALVYTEEPVTETTPLTFVPATVDDIKPYAELMGWEDPRK